jgi:cytochrome c oxidase assembly protein subunit 15
VLGIEQYRKYALFTLLFTVAVIVWGAYVRASGSGAGCGAHWPLCNGVVVPQTARYNTFVEFSHRLSSGALLILVGGLLGWALKIHPRGSFQRRTAVLAFVAVVLEALIGALIVLVRMVEQDKSVERVISISLHLSNTLFLLACITCAWLSAGKAKARWSWRDHEGKRWPLWLTLGFVALAGFGAVAALGDTLFPPTSVLATMLRDFQYTSHLSERVRILHPVLAVCWVGAFAYWLGGAWEKVSKPLAQLALSLAGLNLLLGLCNIAFLAPLPLQMLHLTVANALWIAFVALLFSAVPQLEWK